VADDIPQFSRGDVISSRFEIERFLGEGTLGATYLVRHIKSNKHLALKFMRARFVKPERLNRFKNTIRAARELKHDGIVRYGDVSEHNELIYIVQEYFPGEDLRALLDQYQSEQKSFTLQEACQIVLKTCSALKYLHSQGMVHSHLKPENIVIRSKATGPGGKKLVRTIKITDVGMARILAATGADDGSPYRAPELGLGAGTPPSDVYSVGVMLYELLVG
jgi:serine/threonine-protein kinase